MKNAQSHLKIQAFLHHQSVSLQVEEVVRVDRERERHVAAGGDLDQLDIGRVVLRDGDGTRRDSANWQDREWKDLRVSSPEQMEDQHQAPPDPPGWTFNCLPGYSQEHHQVHRTSWTGGQKRTACLLLLCTSLTKPSISSALLYLILS